MRILAILFCLCLIGCDDIIDPPRVRVKGPALDRTVPPSAPPIVPPIVPPDRFSVVSVQRLGVGTHAYVLLDTKTEKHYLMVMAVDGAAITPLLGEDSLLPEKE